MSNEVSTFNLLKEFMREFHNAKMGSGGREIIKKCHICGDSRDPKSKHMYIGLQKRTGVFVYNCFKCNSSGIVNSKFLRDMDPFHDTRELGMEIDKWNRERMNDPKNIIIRDMESVKIRNPYIAISDTPLSRYKIEMFNKRLGVNLTPSELCDLKIIVNIYDFLNMNRITNYTRHQSVMDILNENFMGFLSMDNSYITLRRLCPSGKLPEYIDQRYVNYNIFGKIDNAYRHYIIPNMINPMQRVKIYITEGAYDALSMYLNVVKDKTQCIFTSIGGKSYYMLVKFFLEKYGFIDLEYHLCPDGDIDNDEMYYIANLLKPFGIPVYMHRNVYPGEKDFGVSVDRIKDSCIRII